jgi:hypothetical protein
MPAITAEMRVQCEYLARKATCGPVSSKVRIICRIRPGVSGWSKAHAAVPAVMLAWEDLIRVPPLAKLFDPRPAPGLAGSLESAGHLSAGRFQGPATDPLARTTRCRQRFRAPEGPPRRQELGSAPHIGGSVVGYRCPGRRQALSVALGRWAHRRRCPCTPGPGPARSNKPPTSLIQILLGLLVACC